MAKRRPSSTKKVRQEARRVLFAFLDDVARRLSGEGGEPVTLEEAKLAMQALKIVGAHDEGEAAALSPGRDEGEDESGAKPPPSKLSAAQIRSALSGLR